jgi:hypothetical protein
MARAAMVMPSNTASAWRVSSTRSLKVPGSPSSALQTTRAAAVGPARVAAALPFARGGEARAAAAAQAGSARSRPAGLGASRQHGEQRQCGIGGAGLSSTSARRTWSSTANHSAGQSLTGVPASSRSASSVDARRVQPGDDLVVVDQQRRPLVAQAGAGGGRR